MQERENVLRIFQETKEAVKNDDSAQIKILSNQTTNTASLTQDPDNIAVAVVIYSLSKILERENYQTLPGWIQFYKSYMISIDKAIDNLKRKDDVAFTKDLMDIRLSIEKLSGRLKDYIHDVFRKALINKASKIYEHGISMEKTANLLGISLYELASYAGERQFPEVVETKTVSVKERIKFAMDMFK